jgi:hypothetical protein
MVGVTSGIRDEHALVDVAVRLGAFSVPGDPQHPLAIDRGLRAGNAGLEGYETDAVARMVW